jgi:hypothetical protein
MPAYDAHKIRSTSEIATTKIRGIEMFTYEIV